MQARQGGWEGWAGLGGCLRAGAPRDLRNPALFSWHRLRRRGRGSLRTRRRPRWPAARRHAGVGSGERPAAVTALCRLRGVAAAAAHHSYSQALPHAAACREEMEDALEAVGLDYKKFWRKKVVKSFLKVRVGAGVAGHVGRGVAQRQACLLGKGPGRAAQPAPPCPTTARPLPCAERPRHGRRHRAALQARHQGGG